MSKMSKMKWMMMVRYVEPGGNSDKYSFVVATNECGTQVGIYIFLLSLPFLLSFQYKTIVIYHVLFASVIPVVMVKSIGNVFV